MTGDTDACSNMIAINDCRCDLDQTFPDHLHGELRPLLPCSSRFCSNARSLLDCARVPLHHTYADLLQSGQASAI